MRALAREGMQHLSSTFVCELYKNQIDGDSDSFCTNTRRTREGWGLWMIREILDMHGVVRVVGDQDVLAGLWLHRAWKDVGIGSEAHRMDDELHETPAKSMALMMHKMG